jgi:hypothetical protein
MVEGGNLFDLGHQALVNLLDVRTGKRTSLGERKDGE